MMNAFTVKGEWFLPSSKDIRAHGTLTYHPNEGSHLELYGSLDGDSFLPHCKKTADRTFKHIWLPQTRATASQPKELEFCQRSTNK